LRDGVSHQVRALARALRREGHSVTVHAPKAPTGSAPEEPEEVPVVRSVSVPVARYPGLRWAVFPYARLRGGGPGDSAELVHLHTPGPMGTAGFLMARHRRLPMVGTFHTDVYAARLSFGTHPLVRFFFWMSQWYSLGLYYRCDALTAPTEPARLTLLAHAEKPFRRPVEVVPNGIELDRFRPGISAPDWRGRFDLGPEPLVLYLGRLTRDKGIHRLLDAVAALSDSLPGSVLIGGAGPEEGALRERIRDDPRLARRVRYAGPIAEEEKPAFLSQGDLFALPSVSDTSSVAVLEAMASGLPCLVTDVGGPQALVRASSGGRVVPADRPAALVEALSELLAEPDTRARLRRGAM
ncbi:MAG: glycosyltransferase, partial [Thermoplasmata archaeon]